MERNTLDTLRHGGTYEIFDDKNLGTGNYGTVVFKGIFENTTPCAVKRQIVGKNTAESVGKISREIEILKSINHDNLIGYKMHKMRREAGFTYVDIIMELCDGNRDVDLNMGHSMAYMLFPRDHIRCDGPAGVTRT